MSKKNIIILALVALAFMAGGIYYFLFQKNKNPNSGENVFNNYDIDTITRGLQEFTIEKPDLSEEQKQEYFERFQKERDALMEAIQVVRQEGESARAGLYWPSFNLASIHRDVGAYEKAEKGYLLAHMMQPKAYPPLGNLGDLYFRYLQNPQEAEKYFLQAIEIESDYLPTYYSELYEIYRFHLKDIVKAEQILVSGMAKWPQQTNIMAYLGIHYRESGATQKAIAVYEKMLEVSPDSQVAKNALKELR